jgi:hypothetical protein
VNEKDPILYFSENMLNNVDLNSSKSAPMFNVSICIEHNNEMHVNLKKIALFVF